MSATVAIIGAGIGSIYLVAELGIARHTLRLHDIDATRLADRPDSADRAIGL